MKLIIADTIKLKRELLKHYKEVFYKHDLRRDSLSSLLKGVLFEKAYISNSIDMTPVIIKEGNQIVLSCLLIRSNRLPNALQMAFFQSSYYSKEAFDALLKKAEELALELGCSRIFGSLNIHVNYGLGFLSSEYDKLQSFGTAHNDPYVHDYFLDGGFSPVEMVSFKKKIISTEEIVPNGLRERINKRYTVRPMDLNRLEDEAKLYTRINNDAFSNHEFYYPSLPQEDIELFKSFRPFLSADNLLFVEKEGEPVGFMLWYPDFHEIINKGESIGLKALLSYKLALKKISKFKIVEMGVIKKEQGKGAIVALFDYCYQLNRNKYTDFESGWVLEDNISSAGFGTKWSNGVAKRFRAYIKELI